LNYSNAASRSWESDYDRGYRNFYYAALESKSSFRLLIIEPGEPYNDLGYRLKDVPSPLLETERYEALSYVWGDENSSEYICLTNDNEPHSDIICSRFHIKPNLYKALERLRLKDKQRTIWVDAICINQEDLRERASQVLLMREIYANARQVLI
jgi:hypothetical protein